MDKVTTETNEATESLLLQTVKTEWRVPAAPTSQDAILVQIYPSCLNIGTRHSLGDMPQEIGRDERCRIRISSGSVSRRHACLLRGSASYRVRDLDSTNGTFVNNVQVTEADLRDGDYLRVGECIYRFLAGSNIEAAYHEEIYRLTIIDALTEAHNKRYFQEFLERELARAMRYHRVLSLVFFDLDHFKTVNDVHGHLCGDHILRELAARIRLALRKEELLARYGGEEFAVVLPDTTQDEALRLAERIRELVATEPFRYDDESLFVTVSLGVTTTIEGRTETTEELLRKADEALYLAKNAGRNCVRTADREKPANRVQPT